MHPKIHLMLDHINNLKGEIYKDVAHKDKKISERDFYYEHDQLCCTE